MNTKSLYINLFFLSLFCLTNAQTATIKGIILDSDNLPIPNVNIKAGTSGTVTNDNGFYLLKIKSNQDVLVEFNWLFLLRKVKI